MATFAIGSAVGKFLDLSNFKFYRKPEVSDLTQFKCQVLTMNVAQSQLAYSRFCGNPQFRKKARGSHHLRIDEFHLDI